MSVKAARVLISGRVQGVFFRHWTREQAQGLGVRGWVRNRYGGSVEGHFEGPEEAIDALVTMCHDGPQMAVVEKITIADVEPESCHRFEVRPSA